MTSHRILSQLTARTNRPAAMAPFDEAARQIARGLWPQAVVESGRPIVAVVCNLVPLELIHAVDALPVRLCAGQVADSAAANSAMPRDICQVVKGATSRLDALREQIKREPAAVIIPSTCDWKGHCCGFFGMGEGARVLGVPRDKSLPAARREWRKQIADLADFLAQRTGVAVRRKSLLRSIALYQQASHLGRRLTDLMKREKPPIAGADLMLVFNMFYSLPVQVWLEKAAALLSDVERRSVIGEGSKNGDRLATCPTTRLIVLGAPIIWPNWMLPLLVESLGGTIVADSLCSGYRGFSDLVSVDETSRSSLIEALADRYLLPCTCPCFAPNEEYLWRAENLADDFRASGVIIHHLKSCYLFDMEAKRLEETFRKRNLPLLHVESDYESPAPAALTTRVEAFLELLRQK